MSMLSLLLCWFPLFLWCNMSSALHQLSFSGGGSFGAVEIGILKRLMEIEPKTYDLYTGISAGALNAGILSYYENLPLGIENAENLYLSIRNHKVYSFLPTTGVSILNTKPLHSTLTDIIGSMPNKPVVRALIGASDLYSGKLDIYNFEELNDINKVLVLMSSCALPGIFPPVTFNNKLYADGGVLSNELIQVEHDNNFLNITFITPYEEYTYDNEPITSLKDMLCRTMKIISHNFNNPMASMNQNCKSPIGEINMYFVPSEVLKKYNILDFDKSAELIDIGYKHMISKKYTIC